MATDKGPLFGIEAGTYERWAANAAPTQPLTLKRIEEVLLLAMKPRPWVNLAGMCPHGRNWACRFCPPATEPK